MPKRRRKGVVTAPDLQDLYTPPSSSKKARPSNQKTPESDSIVHSDGSPRLWDVQEVSSFLKENGIEEEVTKLFEDSDIQGRHLFELTQEDIKEMGIRTLGTQKEIILLIRKLRDRLQPNIKQEKVFNDPIHGHIELHSLMVKIIDTAQFQRLRYIKQLGGGYYVFPGASHNRFEHSIGVGFLAGELVETLKRKQPELDITEKDVLCVKIAGLCHDLGHGPFSHMFDGKFIPQTRPHCKWRHEQASVMMFEHLLEVNNLKPILEEYGLNETDIKFIKEQIAGPLESELCSQVDGEWPYQGRPDSKSFLYEIVANKRNGIDVDKWDYFARDCHCLGIPNNFDLKRFMKFARVIVVNNRRQICTRDKEVHNLYEMFHTRSSLHRRAYQHKTSKIIENMLTEALVKANDFFLIPGEAGPVKMSDAIYDPYAYTRLTDHIFQQILMTDDPKLEESRQLLHKVETRQLYKSIGQTQPPRGKKVAKEEAGSIARDIIKSLSDEERGSLPKLVEDDILVDVVTFDYGMKDDNPIDHVRFYVKDQPYKAIKVRKDQVSQMLPEKFMEQHIRVYCKHSDENAMKSARKYFIAWCRKENCVTPKAGVFDVENESDLELDEFTPYSTPMKLQTDSGNSDHSASRTPLGTGEVVKKLQFTVQNMDET